MTDNKLSKVRIKSVDLMKGFAIILVVLGHAIGAVTSSKVIMEIPYSFYLVYNWIYSFHMPIFFIVAGFFIERWTKRSRKEAVLGKFYRLAIPYFIWGLLFAIYKQIGGGYSNHSEEGILSFLWSPLIPWNIFWFLYVMFIIQIFYYVIVNIFNNYAKGQKVFMGISIVMFLLYPYFPDVWIIHRLGKFTIFFALGTYMIKYLADFEQKMNIKRLIVSVVAFCVISYVFLFYTHEDMLFPKEWIFLLTGCIGTLLVVTLSCYVSKIKILFNFVRYCGEKSMEIYLLHPFVLGFIRVCADKILGFELLWFKTMFLFILSMAICCLIWYHIRNDNSIYKLVFGIK
ncbi:acyltransferase family protein [Selenomonas ruminantium]|uniref:acyltransferase family protein n=1 Tax=Selenomonas ruminantium TaxID=971 RepID=UPI0003FB79CA|nr:acyltransferase [Selenomonas ruminantium]